MRSVRARSRFALLAMPLLGLVAVAVAFALPSPEQREQVRSADAAAGLYERRLDESVSKLPDQVRRAVTEHTDDFDKALDLVRKRTEALPSIGEGGTTDYGRKHSDRYQEARARRSLELQPYARLIRTLTGAVPIQEFIEIGTRVIRINPASLLKDLQIADGEPVRDNVVPAYRAVRKDLDKSSVPSGSEVLRRDLRAYIKDAISMAEDGAKDLDAGRPFFFDFGKRPKDLQRRLVDLQKTLSSQVLQVLDEITAPK